LGCALQNARRSRQEARGVIAERKGKGKAEEPKNEGNNITFVSPQCGTNETYTLRRLKRDEGKKAGDNITSFPKGKARPGR
jgi:hypothetical protein